jgi:hypothetical protein
LHAATVNPQHAVDANSKLKPSSSAQRGQQQVLRPAQQCTRRGWVCVSQRSTFQGSKAAGSACSINTSEHRVGVTVRGQHARVHSISWDQCRPVAPGGTLKGQLRQLRWEWTANIHHKILHMVCGMTRCTL